jgi:hypothetical protein
MAFASLREQPWWTAADDAELDVLVSELVRRARQHRDHCSVCSAGGPWCPGMVEALEIVIEWRDGRILRSKANYLRELETVREGLHELKLLKAPA